MDECAAIIHYESFLYLGTNLQGREKVVSYIPVHISGRYPNRPSMLPAQWSIDHPTSPACGTFSAAHGTP